MNSSSEKIELEFECLFSKRASKIKPGLERIKSALSFFPFLLNPSDDNGKNVFGIQEFKSLGSAVANLHKFDEDIFSPKQNRKPGNKAASKRPYRILVGGTNGKGTTSGMLFHLLSNAGYKVGLFTSPHICHFRERIQVTGENIDDLSLSSLLNDIRGILPKQLYDDMSFFEVSTVMASLAFFHHKCDVEIYEVGLGGRWDSTNIFDPDLSIITSIGYDHQAWLGETLEEILNDKLYIGRSGKPLLWGEPCLGKDRQGLLEILTQRSTTDGFLIHNICELAKKEGNSFSLHLPAIKNIYFDFPKWFDTSAQVIRDNFLLSFSAMIYFLSDIEGKSKDCTVSISRNALKKFAGPETHWPPSLIGRFQPLTVKESLSGKVFPMIVDVCHNIDSVLKLIENINKLAKDQAAEAQGIRAVKPYMHTEDAFRRDQTHGTDFNRELCLSGKKKLPGIVSIAKDKEVVKLLQHLRSVLDPIVVFKMDNDRSLTREQISPLAENMHYADSFSAAWRFATEHFDVFQTPWVVCGSFFAVGEVLNYFDAFPKKPQMQTALLGSFTSEYPLDVFS
ncbi:MAG: Mur ligase family protein [Bdellovibrionota bacterium]